MRGAKIVIFAKDNQLAIASVPFTCETMGGACNFNWLGVRWHYAGHAEIQFDANEANCLKIARRVAIYQLGARANYGDVLAETVRQQWQLFDQQFAA